MHVYVLYQLTLLSNLYLFSSNCCTFERLDTEVFEPGRVGYQEHLLTGRDVLVI